MKEILQLTVAMAVLFLKGCIAPIDIKTNDAEPRLVIYGAISDDSTRHYIKISKSTGYFSQHAPPPIQGAKITMTTQSGITYNFLPDTVAGRYVSDTLKAQWGQIYTLNVELDFDNDKKNEHYQAKSLMPRKPRADSVRLLDMAIRKIPILMLYGEVYKDTENNFCFYTCKKGDTIRLFDYYMIVPEHLFVTTGSSYPVPYLTRDGISKGDTLYFRADNFNDNYARFMMECASEMSAKTPFFSSPPAEVITNIKCLDANTKVSGFFTTYSRGDDLWFIAPFDYNN